MRINNFVFDTNSLVSALLIPSSVSRKALDRATQNGNLIFSEETLAELNTVLVRSKFDRYIQLQKRMEFINLLEIEAKFTEPTSNFTDCRDIKDNKFLNLAFDCKASYIIIGDHDLLVLNPFHLINIITPGEFLNTTSL